MLWVRPLALALVFVLPINGKRRTLTVSSQYYPPPEIVHPWTPVPDFLVPGLRTPGSWFTLRFGHITRYKGGLFISLLSPN